MLQNILFALISVFAVYGLMGVLWYLALELSKPRGGSKYVLLVDCRGDEDAVAKVSCLLSRLRVTGELRYVDLVALCEENSEAQRALRANFGKEKRICIIVDS